MADRVTANPSKVLCCEHENCAAPADYRLHISLANRQIVWLLRCSNHLGKACLPQGCTVGEMRSVEYQPRESVFQGPRESAQQKQLNTQENR